MGRRTYSEAEREAARQTQRDTLEAMHQQITEGVRQLDGVEAWTAWLAAAHRFHRYSFNNTMLILLQTGGRATTVAGYRAWQALGYQVRRGEKAIKVLGPVTRRVEVLDPQTGQPRRGPDGDPITERQMVGFKPVSVFDAAQVEPPPPQPPQPVLLTGQAPDGLWDALAAIVSENGFAVVRGDCGRANGYTDFATKTVTVRDDIDDAQAVKTLAHELGHVLLPPPDIFAVDTQCRGLREVEAESVAYMVTQAHGLDSSQYTFGYVAGWASQAAAEGESVDDILRATGERVIGAVDHILSRTMPNDLEVQAADAVAANLGIVALPPAPDSPETGAVTGLVVGTLAWSVATEAATPPMMSPSVQPPLIAI